MNGGLGRKRSGAFFHPKMPMKVCAMADVLEVYKKPSDPEHPLVCMFDTSKQQIKEVRQPIPVQPGEPERYDTSSERNFV